uniref:Schlafen AlbA-2 domain-containing protein n=1 Tax=Pygocentrus nattereri TaxID=42514 RepID=A0A3B4ED87_PYGNA
MKHSCIDGIINSTNINTCTFHYKHEWVVWIEETTFGEEARKKMDNNKRRQQREVFLRFICALLNSGGGYLFAKNANQQNKRHNDALGSDLEKGLNELLYPKLIQDFIHITQNENELQFHVKPWCSCLVGEDAAPSPR